MKDNIRCFLFWNRWVFVRIVFIEEDSFAEIALLIIINFS